MNIAIVYYSKTGHSRKIAAAISDSLGIEAYDIKNNPALGQVDLLFIVGAIYGGKSSPELIAYAKSLDSALIGKVVLVTSCLSNMLTQDSIREVLEQKHIEVSPDEFLCKGNFLFFGWGHPNAYEVANAVAFAKECTTA